MILNVTSGKNPIARESHRTLAYFFSFSPSSWRGLFPVPVERRLRQVRSSRAPVLVRPPLPPPETSTSLEKKRPPRPRGRTPRPRRKRRRPEPGSTGGSLPTILAGRWLPTYLRTPVPSLRRRGQLFARSCSHANHHCRCCSHRNCPLAAGYDRWKPSLVRLVPLLMLLPLFLPLLVNPPPMVMIMVQS